MSILLAGFLLGLSLIIAIGPQNAYIIKMGVKRDHISAIILACLLSDVILINAGVGGMGVLVEKFPTGLVIMKYLGAAYLLYFGFSCFRDAFKKEQEALVVENTQPTVQPQPVHGSTAIIPKPRLKSRTWLKPVMGAMALTWLNPWHTLTYWSCLAALHSNMASSAGFCRRRTAGQCRVVPHPGLWSIQAFACACKAHHMALCELRYRLRDDDSDSEATSSLASIFTCCLA